MRVRGEFDCVMQEGEEKRRAADRNFIRFGKRAKERFGDYEDPEVEKRAWKRRKMSNFLRFGRSGGGEEGEMKKCLLRFSLRRCRIVVAEEDGLVR